MRPYKSPTARKKNVRNARGLSKTLQRSVSESHLRQVNKRGFNEEQMLWDPNHWFLYQSFDKDERPKNLVKVRKAGHLRLIPSGSIVFANLNFRTPRALNGKFYVIKNPKWTKRSDQNLQTWQKRWWEWATKMLPSPVDFPPGYIIFEKTCGSQYSRSEYIGTYMFGMSPQLRFVWDTCWIGEDVLPYIVQGLKHGKEIYKKELKYLGLTGDEVPQK